MSDSPELKKRKKELREKILQKRDALSAADRKRYSARITQKILEFSGFRKSGNILCYVLSLIHI